MTPVSCSKSLCEILMDANKNNFYKIPHARQRLQAAKKQGVYFFSHYLNYFEYNRQYLLSEKKKPSLH